MRVNDGFAKRQSEASSPLGAGSPHIDAIEAIEDPLLVFRADADPGVVHPEARPAGSLAGSGGDGTAGRGVRQSVIDQIDQQLDDQILVDLGNDRGGLIEQDDAKIRRL